MNLKWLMIQNIILPKIGLPQENTKKTEIQGDHCIRETPYRETTVFRSHDPKYYTTSDWLAPGKHKNKRHTGRPLCCNPMTQHLLLHQIGLHQENYL